MTAIDPAVEEACFEALAAARAYVKGKAPYITDTLYSLIPKLLPGFGNIATTDRHVLLLDPEMFLALGDCPSFANEEAVPAEQRADALRGGVLMHEMSHLLRDMERLKDLLPEGKGTLNSKEGGRINKAFDIPINDDLSDAGWLLPNFGCFSSKFGFPKGLTGEQYYELLKAKEEKEESSGGSEGKDGEEENEGKVTAGGCGSCAGNPGEGEAAGEESKANTELGRSTADCDRIIRGTAKAIKEYAQGLGSVPASLLSNLPPDEKRSVIPWKSKLATIARRVVGKVVSGYHDFSMRRISKRSLTRGIVRPGMITRVPNVVFIEDSSGSMGVTQLLSARREGAGIMQQCGIGEVWFMDADAAVSSTPKLVRVRDLATLPVHGGGGTNFGPALEKAKALKPHPDICFYFTDGDGYAPEIPPYGMVVVWVIVPSPYGRAPAKWGHLIVVSDEQELRDPYENR